MACESVPLDWPQSQLLLLEDGNIHIDNTIKKIIEEEEDTDEDEDEEEEEDEDLWETEDEDDDEMSWYEDDDEEDDEEEEMLSPKRSLANVEGAIPKSIIRKLPNTTIRKIIFHTKNCILSLETENYLYEKTIDKLEASERDFNFKMNTIGDEEFDERLKRARIRVCSSDEEEDEAPPEGGRYKGIVALDSIHVSQDSFFENMSDNSKGEAMRFFKTATAMAPENYDAMHHRYGDYVGTAAEKTMFAGEPGIKSRLNSLILNSRIQLDEKMKTSGQVDESDGKAKKSNDTSRKTGSSGSSLALTEEENIDLAVAKKLSITDRLRFAQDEEDEFTKRFYEHETQALKDESSIQVHIDAHKQALEILMGIRNDFRLIAKGATGAGMNGKVIADLIVKFRLRMKNQLSVHENRTRILVRKVMKQKKRILDQLNINKDMGRGVSHVDFEYMLCEGSIMEKDINDMNITLQQLKDLTAQFHRVLQDERHMKGKMQIQEKTMNQELKRRHEILSKFHVSYNKYQQQIDYANTKMDSIKKRFSETLKVPQPLDYIRQKTEQFELEAEVQGLEFKLQELYRNMERTQRKYDKYVTLLPPGTKTAEEETEEWMAQIKLAMKQERESQKSDQHISQKLHFLEPEVPEVEEDDDEAWSHDDRLGNRVLSAGKLQQRLTMSARMSMKGGDRRVSHLSHLSQVLLQPTRFDPRRSMLEKLKSHVYDFDFDQLDQRFLDDDDDEYQHKKDSMI